MARMIPARDYTDFHDSPAERRVFDCFESNLSNEYKIFHSEHWFRAPSQSRTDQNRGEIDFLVCHPDRGLLVLEIKGGGIGYDAEKDTWYSVGRDQRYELDKSPAIQAQAAMHNLLKRIKDHPKIGSKDRFSGLVGWGLFFPDLDRVNGVDLPDLELPRERILFNEDTETIETSLTQLYDFWEREVPFSPRMDPSDWEQLTGSFLRREFEIVESLGRYIEKKDRELYRMTEEQKELLNFIRNQKDVFVRGCAGSGKTILSLEQAKRLSDQGKQTVWLCYNKNLRQHVESQTEDQDFEVSHFHSFALEKIKQSGINFEYPKNDEDWGPFWEVEVPSLLEDAADMGNERYDALIIDEGQDFRTDWFMPLLDWTVKDRWLYVFYDPNQSLYGSVPDWLTDWEDEFFSLNKNVRNTKDIGQASVNLGAVNEEIRFGPEGRPVQIELSQNEEGIVEDLQSAVHKLFINEQLDPDRSVILTRHLKENSPLAGIDQLGNYRIVKNSSRGNRNQILWSTIKSYKGLEADVVLLVIPEWKQQNARQFYTGASRAKHLLWVFTADANVRKQLKQ